MELFAKMVNYFKTLDVCMGSECAFHFFFQTLQSDVKKTLSQVAEK